MIFGMDSGDLPSHTVWPALLNSVLFASLIMGRLP